MKAKEYARVFIEKVDKDNATQEVFDEEIVNILRQFLLEGKDLIIKRNIQTNSGVYALISELSLKWKVFANIVNEHYNVGELIKVDGFKTYIETSILLQTLKE